jgi:hypothetical protein
MIKHTPGPWFVIVEESSFHVCQSPFEGAVLEVAIVDPVEDVDGVVQISLERAEANARLVAAAPKMLEALKACLAELIQNETANEPGSLMDRELKQAVRLAQNAIAKAEVKS